MSYLTLCDFNETLADKLGRLSQTTISLLHEYLKSNKLCILSLEDYTILDELLSSNQLSCDFFSLSSSMGKISGQITYGALEPSVLNSFITKFENYIYTAYASSPDTTYIYHYQERLNAIYPKNNRKIVDSFLKPLPSLILALQQEGFDQFSSFIKTTSYSVEILARDKNRIMIKISPKGYTKEDIVHILHSHYANYTLIGIGDSISDYDFIKHCSIQIAMKNAEAELKSLCQITTEFSCEEDGCMKALLSIDNTRHF